MKPYPFLTWSPPQARWPLPLLLCLHGSGECGTDLERVAQHGPLLEARLRRRIPFLVVAPQAEEEIWDPLRLVVTLDAIEHHYRVQPQRVYVTGYSMGGDGTWALAMHARQRLAAIAPLCGGGDVHKVKRLLNFPIWNFHGGQDTEVALAESEVLIQALRRSGSKNLRFTIYPNAGHDIWTRTYSNPELYTWLLAQQNSRPQRIPNDSRSSGR